MLWLDGVPEPHGSGLDRGLEFGDGLFETIAVVDGRPRLLQRHLERLEAGCRRLGIAGLSLEHSRAEVTVAAAEPGTGVVKLIVTRGAGGTGYRAPASLPPRRWVAALPARARDASAAQDGVAVGVVATRLSIQPMLAGLKHLNRLEQVLARRELADRALAEGLMCDMDGRLVCGTMSNVFLVIAGRIVTPKLERAGVLGVMRGALLEAWRGEGTEVEVRDVAPAELATAEEVFLSNALIGVWPVAAVEGIRLSPGRHARQAQAWVAGW